MTPKKSVANSDSKPQLEIADPLEDLRKAFNDRTQVLAEDAKDANAILNKGIVEVKASLEESIKGNNRIITFVILVMAIGFLTLLFALASTLIVSWQSNQTVHDAVQLQLNSRSTK